MSYDIFYRRQFIKINENQFIVIVEGGSSNLREATRFGKRVRSWYDNKYCTGGKIIVSIAEVEKEIEEARQKTIQRNTERNEENPHFQGDVYNDENFGYFTSLSIRNNSCFRTSFSMYKSFIMGGFKEALTLEQLREKGITVTLSAGQYYNKEELQGKEPFHSYPKTTEELVKEIEEKTEYLKGTKIPLWIGLNGSYAFERIARERAKPKREKQPIIVKEFFVILCKGYGHFIKATSKNFHYCYNGAFSAKRFLKEGEAKKQKEKLEKRFTKIEFDVEKVEKEVTIYR